MLTISKTFEFCSSHTLAREDWNQEQNFKIYGKCSNPSGHGHNYKLEVTVSGAVDNETGMIFDASILDQIVQDYIIKDLDHKNLNKDVDWLQNKFGTPPTSEVIIESIWNRLEPEITKSRSLAKLEKLVLHETSRIFATKVRK